MSILILTEVIFNVSAPPKSVKLDSGTPMTHVESETSLASDAVMCFSVRFDER